MPTKSETLATSIRLTPVAMELWQEISREHGMNRTATLELMIREKASTLGVKISPKPETQDKDKR